ASERRDHLPLRPRCDRAQRTVPASDPPLVSPPWSLDGAPNDAERRRAFNVFPETLEPSLSDGVDANRRNTCLSARHITAIRCKSTQICGSPTRARTWDLRINSPPESSTQS